MSLSSSSTLAQIEAAYDDNASYQELGDVAACKTFITACRMLLRRYAEEAQFGNRHRMRFGANLEQLRLEMTRAMQWLASNNAANQNQVIFPDFSSFRG